MKSSSETTSMETQIAKWTGIDVRAMPKGGYLHMLPVRLSLQ